MGAPSSSSLRRCATDRRTKPNRRADPPDQRADPRLAAQRISRCRLESPRSSNCWEPPRSIYPRPSPSYRQIYASPSTNWRCNRPRRFLTGCLAHSSTLIQRPSPSTSSEPATGSTVKPAGVGSNRSKVALKYFPPICHCHSYPAGLVSTLLCEPAPPRQNGSSWTWPTTGSPLTAPRRSIVVPSARCGPPLARNRSITNITAGSTAAFILPSPSPEMAL